MSAMVNARSKAKPKLDERVAKELRRGVSFDQFVHRNIPDSYSKSGKESIVARFFVVSLEHHRAMAHLLGSGQYITSARSLMRPLLESATRGGWLGSIASEAEIEQISLGRLGFPSPLQTAKLLDALEAAPPLASIASKIELLNDYTHTGIRQADLQVHGTFIGGHYDPQESIALLVDALHIFAAATVHMLNGLGKRCDAQTANQVYEAFNEA